ncbi:sulfotransferase family protein [Escherichia sp. E10V10]|uniref:sulfotransferase family protein n=1 Tax=Escherichia sp. E10V10 TaxID=2478970 RepID=UPI001F0F012A|nr:sulfotransferase family protein [Escherichia sp. E10V10]
MNKIIIVGHPNSNLDIVEKISLQYGMGIPRLSKRENLSPQDITKIICKAYNAPKISEVTNISEFSPLQVSAVWHGMALDLFLNNLERNFWGWSDPYAIYTLDYWASLDENLTFILVYDHPRSVLEQAANSQESFINNTIEHLIDNWIAYNTALLDFYSKNRERCLLISTGQIKNNTEGFLEKLQSVLKKTLNICSFQECINTSIHSYSEQASASPLLIDEEAKQEIMALSGIDIKIGDKFFNKNIAEDYLLKMLLTQYPESQCLYRKLQLEADIPALSGNEEKLNPNTIWTGLVQQRLITIEIISKLHQLYKTSLIDYKIDLAQQTEAHYLLSSQLNQMKEKFEHYYARKKELHAKNRKLKSKLKKQTSFICKKEKELRFIENEFHNLKNKIEYNQNTKEKDSSDVKELKKHLDDLNNQLAKEKSNQDLQKQQLDRITKEKNLMLTQLHLVQEKLEQYYLENQKLKQQQFPELYGAAERIKEGLEYRLGAIMIQHSKSIFGVISMPIAIVKERKIWHKQYISEKQSDLPPLCMYRDAHEANRVKQHLSYMLGKILVQKKGSIFGFITLPFSIYRTVRQFKKAKKNKVIK